MMKINNPNNENHQVNPELFKSEIAPELVGQTYYAYIDSLEQIDGIIHVRFDCILKERADSVSINRESILGFPSIIIDSAGPIQIMRERFKYGNLYLLESSWVLLRTSINETILNQSQYFNFYQVSNNENPK